MSGFVYSIDMDECKLYSPCDQECTNLPGSFECSCKAGYVLHVDGTTCIGERVASTYNTVYTCLGSFMITVKMYFLSDVDECMEAALYGIELCSENTVCLNNEGSYECPCISGFHLTNGTCQSEL